MIGLWSGLHPRSLILVSLLLAGCGLPRDPAGTSERISSSHEIRVGVTDNPPWTKSQFAEPEGVEPTLVRQFASDIGAKVIWTGGSETSLAEALKRHELDLVVGGFDTKTPWKSIAGVSQPFAETPDKKKHVFLTAPGENRFILTLDRFLSQHARSAKGPAA